MVASRRTDDGAVLQWSLRLPRLPQHFTGTGDLTAALLLAWSHKLSRPEQLADVLERVGASLQAVLALTHKVRTALQYELRPRHSLGSVTR